MKYKIKNSDLLINNKLYSEGSEVELSKDLTKGIENFLIPLSQTDHSELTEGHPEQSEGSQIVVSKTKTKGSKK